MREMSERGEGDEGGREKENGKGGEKCKEVGGERGKRSE